MMFLLISLCKTTVFDNVFSDHGTIFVVLSLQLNTSVSHSDGLMMNQSINSSSVLLLKTGTSYMRLQIMLMEHLKHFVTFSLITWLGSKKVNVNFFEFSVIYNKSFQFSKAVILQRPMSNNKL